MPRRPGCSAVSPPTRAVPVSAHPAAMPRTMSAMRSREDLAARDVVGHEQRLRADHDDVVDDHADEVEADRVVLVDRLGDRDLRADAVGARREQRLGVRAQGGGVEQTGETADPADDLGSVRAPDRGLHELDREVACGGVDAGGGIGIHGGVARGGSHALQPTGGAAGACAERRRDSSRGVGPVLEWRHGQHGGSGVADPRGRGRSPSCLPSICGRCSASALLTSSRTCAASLPVRTIAAKRHRRCSNGSGASTGR